MMYLRLHIFTFELVHGHDGNWGLLQFLSHPLLHQVEHVLVEEQSNQVKGTEGSRRSQCEISDYH